MFTIENIKYALIVFLSILFPVSAFAYQLFQRERHLQELKMDFNLLGIGNALSMELTEKYKRSYHSFSFLAHSMMPAVFSAFGAVLLLTDPDVLMRFFGVGEETTVIMALRYGFMGAYVFSIQLVYRRYTTLDLQPTVYMNCTITLIAGMAFNYTAFAAIDSLNVQNASTGFGAGLFAIISFSLGYFPLLAIRWFNQIANEVLGNKKNRAEGLSLSVIDGISQFHETRLRDEGIDNVQNLASVKIDELVLNTRFNVQQVLEWIDQAYLHLYLDPGKIDSFRRGGVRTISDFQALWAPYLKNISKIAGGPAQAEPSQEMKDARQNRALQLQSTPEHLDALYATTLTGPNMAYIGNYWKNLREHIQERQSTAVEEARERAKSVVKETQITIFKKISEKDLFDKNRETLGEIAEALSPDFYVDLPGNETVDGQPDVLAGFAWWLWWITDRMDNDNDFTELACDYYEKAVEESSGDPKKRFELAKFYCDRTEDYKKCEEHAQKAAELARETGEYETTLMSLAILAYTCLKSGKKSEGAGHINEAVDILQNQDIDVSKTDILESFPQILKKFNHMFEDDSPPEEVSDFLCRIEAICEHGSAGENHTTGRKS